jgi:hypothetical protein
MLPGYSNFCSYCLAHKEMVDMDFLFLVVQLQDFRDSGGKDPQYNPEDMYILEYGFVLHIWRKFHMFQCMD